MKLPTKFEEILKNEQGLYGAVHSTLSTFETWLKQNNLPFFPEYTDHSERHVEEVLVAAQALIRDEAWDVISPEDVAVLSLAILVHDAGMHLSEDGFIKLVSADTSWPASHDANALTWTQLWSDFFSEASRFDARKLKQLFGDDKPVRKPPLDVQEMTRRDRMLIGEFLRRHHPRLAREIALSGVPGPGNAPLTFQNVPEHIAHLAGLVAHSHGVSLRDAAEWLKPEQRRETRGAHVPFLMALLRIADYLRIQQERAPTEVLRIRSLRSPISQGEWNAHGAVKDVNNTQDDIEAIYIHAEPEDVKTFLKLKNLFSSIQHELDTSWAVLGEVYAIHPKLGKLGLSGLVIRRIRSNLDKVEEFGETVSYIPEKISLRTANAELVNLLIEPLYGAHPEIGVRELLQNAVDACIELDDYLAQSSNMKLDFPEQEEHVKIELYVDEAGKRWFRIQDKGIGMTPPTIKNFFLIVGASLRASNLWMQQHVSDSGHSRVLRSGKFGIGMLAAFLISDEVRVVTRHVSQPRDKAITFSLQIGDDAIELLHTQACVGTTVLMAVDNDEIWKKLTNERSEHFPPARDYVPKPWQWYYFEHPKISYSVEGKKLNQLFYPCIPSNISELSTRWRAISYPGYSAIHWHVEDYYNLGFKHDPTLYCNGIFIKKDEITTAYFEDESLVYDLNIPDISVLDTEGNLPVNIRRTDVTSLPFKEELYQDIVKDLLAYMIVNGPEDIYAPLPLKYPLLNTFNIETHPTAWMLCGEEGFVLADKWLIVNLGFERIISILSSETTSDERNNPPLTSKTLLSRAYINDIVKYEEWLERSLEGVEFVRGQIYSRERSYKNILVKEARVQIPVKEYEPYLKLKSKGYEKPHKVLTTGSKIEKWFLFESATIKKENRSTTQLPLGSYNEATAELYVDAENWSAREPSLVGSVWREIIGNKPIPYNLEERKRLLPHSFKMLDEYIQKHAALAEERKTRHSSS